MAEGERDRDERGLSAAERFRRLDGKEGLRERGGRFRGDRGPGRRQRLKASLRQYALIVALVAVMAFLAGILVAQIRGRVLEQVDPAPGQSVGVRIAPADRVVS